MQTPKLETTSLPTGTILYRFNRVPVMAQASFWPVVLALTGVLTWLAGYRKPGRSWRQRLGVGLLAMPIALVADVGHAMAHTVSAGLAGAPMDEVLLSSGMPRTLYEDNAVPPRTHIQRSLGGPLFSLASAALSFLWRRLSPAGSLSRELADISLACHSWILLGSATPLPMVDGGIILKWKLVEAGQSEPQAAQAVRQINLGLGAALLGLGGWIGLLKRRRITGGVLAVGGLVEILAGLGWLK
jgi:hypothetical protein